MKIKKIILRILKWLSPKETTIMDNKHIILKHLFSSDFQELSIKESIELFKDVEKDFNAELSKKYIEAQIIIADIEEYNKEYQIQGSNEITKTKVEEFLNQS
jgi:hypothetical protein